MRARRAAAPDSWAEGETMLDCCGLVSSPPEPIPLVLPRQLPMPITAATLPNSALGVNASIEVLEKSGSLAIASSWRTPRIWGPAVLLPGAPLPAPARGTAAGDEGSSSRVRRAFRLFNSSEYPETAPGRRGGDPDMLSRGRQDTPLRVGPPMPRS